MLIYKAKSRGIALIIDQSRSLLSIKQYLKLEVPLRKGEVDAL